MEGRISFSKINSLLDKIKVEHDVLITEIILNNEQMDFLIEDETALRKYGSNFISTNNIDFIVLYWKYGKVKLKRLVINE